MIYKQERRDSMKMGIRILAFATALATLLLSGCASTLRQPLSVAARESVKLDTAELVSYNDNIQPEASPNVYASGGLIEILIEASIAQTEINDALPLIAPIQKNINNRQIIKNFENNLSENMKKISWLKVHNFNYRHLSPNGSINNLFKHQSANTALFITFNYKLNYHFNALIIEAAVDIQNKKTDTGINFLYSNNFYYIYWLPKNVKTRKASLDLWDKSNGELVKRVMNNGVDFLAHHIVEDIKNPNANLYAAMKGEKVYKFKNDSGYGIEGKLIDAKNGSYVLRASTDEIYIVNKNALLS